MAAGSWAESDWLVSTGERIMPTRQEVAKLGRHLRGLEKYPMSASYPQETGDFEFKKMLQIMRSDNGNKKETTVEIQDGSNSLFILDTSYRLKKHYDTKIISTTGYILF